VKIVYLLLITVSYLVVLKTSEKRRVETQSVSVVKQNSFKIQSTKLKIPASVDKKLIHISVNNFTSLAVEDENNDSDMVISNEQDSRKYINEFVLSINNT
jgi:hypothetical protein